MRYRNARTGEVYEAAARDGRLEGAADDRWLPVNLRDAAAPFDMWQQPASLEAALALIPAEEMETP